MGRFNHGEMFWRCLYCGEEYNIDSDMDVDDHQEECELCNEGGCDNCFEEKECSCCLQDGCGECVTNTCGECGDSMCDGCDTGGICEECEERLEDEEELENEDVSDSKET